MNILKNAVYFQLCFGFPYIVNVDSDARLFEYAFGILFEESIVGGKVETRIVIDEPFIIQTAYNLLSEHTDFLKINAEVKIGESYVSQSRGYLWEVYSIIVYAY